MSEETRLVPITQTQLCEVHGGMQPEMFAAMQKAWDLGLQVQGVVDGNHAPSSRHWRGRGMDLGGSEAGLKKFEAWARGRKGAHEVIYQNRFFKDGRDRPGIGNHDDHLHYSF